MSGTSLDGIDAVLVDLDPNLEQPRLISSHYTPFDDELKTALLELHQPDQGELHKAMITGNHLARLYARSIELLLSQAGIEAAQIRSIGCHGQTIRHCPEHGYTLQIGNAALLSELTGITVVSDFRSRDIAAGGHGAPLVPAFHERYFRHPDIHRVVVNIGGISNLTDLPPGKPATGFDCGPGNLLMDAWNMLHTRKPYDEHGAWGRTGKVLPELLDKCLAERFFSLSPPKSTGRDLFNMSWLQNRLAGNEQAEDVQATLLELTCQAITLSITKYCPDTREIYLCGGGAHNHALRDRLGSLLAGCTIATTDRLGIDGDYLEATAFAWFAQQTIHGKPANLPLVTGARHSCILGAIHPG